MNVDKKIFGLRIISLVVFFSNAYLLLYILILGPSNNEFVLNLALPFLSMLGVFPFDFFYLFLNFNIVHILWILAIMVCSLGILKLNKAARKVFIVFNIVHITVFTYIIIMQIDKSVFLEYFFKLYFNMVASGAYVGLLTIQEVRDQFKIKQGEGRLALFLRHIQIKHFGQADPAGFYNLGLAYKRLERYDDAILALQKAISLESQQVEFHYHLGLIYLEQMKFDKAIQALKEALRLDPIHTQVVFCLGLAYQKEGCDNEAISALRKASHIDPNNPQILHCLGKSLMQSKYYHEAIDVLSRATYLNPNDYDSFQLLGLIYLIRMERFKQAKQSFKRAIQIRPDAIESHYQLGIANIKLNSYKDAIRAFKEVIRLDEDHKQAHYHLGFTYAMIEDFNSARREYNYLKALDVDLATNLSLLIK